MASSNAQFKSREDYKQQKVLDEARKLGQIPAMVDEDGKDINPHMPQYILNAPWYLNQEHPGLKHHLKYKEQLKTEITDWYQKGKKQDQIVTKFRKGACENCGALTHSKKDCMERPRKLGAKFTGQDLQPDEHIQDVALDYDAKRDRYNGYDKEQYQQIIDDYEVLEQQKQNLIKESAANQQQNDDQGDELKQGLFENNAPVANHDPRTKTTTRNLRIREDTAKYLYNLDVNSAYYDPKSRALRENPNLLLPIEKQVFRGDNYNRLNGQALALLEQEKFAWDTVEKKNAELNTIGLPSMTEQLYKTIKERRSNQNTKQNSDLEQIYGSNDNHFTAGDHSLILGQTDQYIEFTSEGKVKHNFAKPKVKSKYPEDVLNGNHLTVWGSWWNKELGWGYACCHSNEKASKCIGERGFKIAIQKEYKVKKAKEEELKNLEKNLHAQEDIVVLEEQQQQQQQSQSIQQLQQIQLQQQSSNKQQQQQQLNQSQTEPVQESSLAQQQQEDKLQEQKKDSNENNNKKKQKSQTKSENKKNNLSKSSNSSSVTSDSSSSSDSSNEQYDDDSSASSSSQSSVISSSSSSSSSQSDKKNKRKKEQKKKTNKRKEKEHKKDHEKQKKQQIQSKEKESFKKQDKKKNKIGKEEAGNKMEIEKDERKRKYNSMHADVNVTEAEIEEYRKKQSRFEDPMRNMKNFDNKYDTVD